MTSRAEFIIVDREVTEYGYQDQISFRGIKQSRECTCGWPIPTGHFDSKELAMVKHRLDHIEGRIK